MLVPGQAAWRLLVSIRPGLWADTATPSPSARYLPASTWR